MDIRGIEVTNQLRSAIRAKLLELGVRYDEELPDYILVMVVNKKTRQQMYEDLCLFLEESTSPFVDWLHDQVLKKLQKVTVTKKKSSRDLVPTVIVKQEEERKKKKSCPATSSEDQTNDLSDKFPAKISKVAKIPKKTEKPTKPVDSVIHGLENAANKSSQLDKLAVTSSESKSSPSLNLESSQNQNENNTKNVEPLEHSSKSSIEAEISMKIFEISSKNSEKIPSNLVEDAANKVEASAVTARPPSSDEMDGNSDEGSQKKVKSSVNKPRITSVVTVKNRLEFPGPRNKFGMYKNRLGIESRHKKTVRGNEKNDFDSARWGGDIISGRNNRGEDNSRRNMAKTPEFETKTNETEKIVDIKSRLGHICDDKFNKSVEAKDKSGLISNSRMRNTEKLSSSIKNRLGSGNSVRMRENLSSMRKESSDQQRNLKFVEKESPVSNANLSIKNRLGPLKNIFKSPDIRRRLNPTNKSLASSEDEDCSSFHDTDNADGSDDDKRSAAANGPVKSRIIAIKRNVTDKSDRKRVRLIKRTDRGGRSDNNDDDKKDTEDGKIASKVIVTPRPLKPLQPLQKRATQSLLLRAVAEANQSVVKQKNPEPVLTKKKTTPKRPASTGILEGQNLSVRLNSSKRLVMEKIQVELTTGESNIENPEPYVPQPVTEEHMGVVMSLFQRSNDSQKFLVTLNGYNNNVPKEKSVSDEDERMEMEVNEDDDFVLNNPNFEEYIGGKVGLNGFQLVDMEAAENINNKIQTEGNRENLNIENVEADQSLPRKKRKLSPIVYNRSRSPSPVERKLSISPAVSAKNPEKYSVVENSLQQSMIDQSSEKCRYWPNCTLGIKCSYYHPAALCSAFPACKFGETCSYKHPKCKFGLSCTKLGCVYRHPPRHCKYHPYCTNPTCTYTHPLPQVQTVELSNRAKFTWRKHE